MVRTHINPELHLTTLLSIVVDLEDIQAMIEGDADPDEQHNSPQIHLERWARLKRRAMSALHYSNVPSTEEDAHQIAKEYLTAGLQRVLGEDLDQEKSSLILKEEENRVMFKMAGFRVQPPDYPSSLQITSAVSGLGFGVSSEKSPSLDSKSQVSNCFKLYLSCHD